MAHIHPTALVHPEALVDPSVVIGPYCVVGPGVRIGARTTLHSHVVVGGLTTLGEDNQVFPFASVGQAPQDLKYNGEPTQLIIGNGNRIRECATLQPGTVQGGGVTRIGDNNLFMAYSHAAHDCQIGNHNVFANSVALAGHVTIGNYVVCGGLSAVHQHCSVGDLGMVGAGSIAVNDIPPYCTAEGTRASLRGLNLVGIKRQGYSAEVQGAIKKMYRILFTQGHATIQSALEEGRQQGLLDIPQVAQLALFVEASKRGVARPHRGPSSS